mmetsp:Transcript_6448/g.11883  ORF Transcript_6448/g.11883 Transcript_6448/m.11883 type:complete len:314 (+) Transcript_6448:131-1072(+)
MRLNVRIRGWQRLYRLLYKVFLLIVVLPNKVVHGIGVRDSTNPDPAGSGGPPPPPHAHVHPSSSVKGTCTSTSISLTVDFPSHPSTDLYYVAVSASNSSKPFLLKTVAEYDTPGDMIQLTIEDLLPNRTYWLRVRSHPESEATIAWGPGWRSYGEGFPCRTKAVESSAASTVKRVGGLSPTSISLEWRPPRRAAAAVHGYRVWYERHQYHWSRGERRQYHWSEGERRGRRQTQKKRDDDDDTSSRREHFRGAWRPGVQFSLFNTSGVAPLGNLERCRDISDGRILWRREIFSQMAAFVPHFRVLIRCRLSRKP